jgi:hypothetical protein
VDEMKTSTKLTIGVSVVAVAGVVTAAVVSDKVLTKVRYASNRWKVKKFVSDKFDGNETLLGVVDNLSDRDIDNVMTVVKKVKKGKKQVSVYGNNVKETTENVKEKLQDFVSSVFE